MFSNTTQVGDLLQPPQVQRLSQVSPWGRFQQDGTFQTTLEVGGIWSASYAPTVQWSGTSGVKIQPNPVVSEEYGAFDQLATVSIPAGQAAVVSTLVSNWRGSSTYSIPLNAPPVPKLIAPSVQLQAVSNVSPVGCAFQVQAISGSNILFVWHSDPSAAVYQVDTSVDSLQINGTGGIDTVQASTTWKLKPKTTVSVWAEGNDLTDLQRPLGISSTIRLQCP